MGSQKRDMVGRRLKGRDGGGYFLRIRYFFPEMGTVRMGYSTVM